MVAAVQARSVHLILILAQACFASMAVVGRVAMAGGARPLPPNAIVLARVVGGGLAFWLLARRGGPITAGLERRDLPRLVACALLGVVVNQVLFLNGLARTTAVNASVIGASFPLFAALCEILLLVVRAHAARLAGIVVAFAGILVLMKIERFSLDDGDAVGNLMVFANALSYGMFLVLVKPLAMRVQPMALVTLLFAAALPFVLPLSIGAWIDLGAWIGAREVGLLVYFVAIPTVGAYALTQVALARADASLVAVYIYLQPIFATAGAMLLLGERPGIRTLVAAGIIAIGLAIASRSPARTAPPAIA